MIKAAVSRVKFPLALAKKSPQPGLRAANERHLLELGVDPKVAERAFTRFDIDLSADELFRLGGRQKRPLKVEIEGKPYDFEPAHLESKMGQRSIVIGLLRGSSEAYLAAMRLKN